MTNIRKAGTLHPSDVIRKYGKCLELIPMDPHFHDITVGGYLKDRIVTVWTYSQKPAVKNRILIIRNQLLKLGGLKPVKGTDNQAQFPCGHVHERALKFALTQAVEKPPDYTLPEGVISIKDTKTKLTLTMTSKEIDDRWIYSLSANGEAPNIPLRLRAIVAGFLRYGEMKKMSDTQVAFQCGYQHINLARLLIPYSRNVSMVEDVMEATALRGQMTTETLGFSQR